MKYAWSFQHASYERLMNLLQTTKPKLVFLKTLNEYPNNKAFLFTIAWKVPNDIHRTAYTITLDVEPDNLNQLMKWLLDNDVIHIGGWDLKNDIKGLWNAKVNLHHHEFNQQKRFWIDTMILKRLNEQSVQNINFDMADNIAAAYKRDENFLSKNYAITEHRQSCYDRALTFSRSVFDFPTPTTHSAAVLNTILNYQDETKTALINDFQIYSTILNNYYWSLYQDEPMSVQTYCQYLGAYGYELFEKWLQDYLKKYNQSIQILGIESRALWVFSKIENNGLTLDTSYLEDSIRAINALKRTLNDKLNTLTHGALNLDHQNKTIFEYFIKNGVEYHLLNSKIDRQRMFQKIINEINDYELKKVCEIYIQNYHIQSYEKQILKLLAAAYLNNKIKPSFQIEGTITGRAIGTLQQIPKNPLVIDGETICNIREAFVVDKDNGFESVVYLDFNQFELRVLAEVMLKNFKEADTNLLRAFVPQGCYHYQNKHEVFNIALPQMKGRWNEGQKNQQSVWINENNQPWKPTDLHLLTAVAAFGEQILKEPPEKLKRYRELGKVTNFTMNYGGGFQTLCKKNEIFGLDNEIINNLMNAYRNNYPLLTTYKRLLRNETNTNKGLVTNIFGRIYQIPESHIFYHSYKMINWIIQGTAADLMKCVLVWIDEFLTTNNYKTQLVHFIHDEIVLQVHRDDGNNIVSEIKTYIENKIANQFVIPMVITVKTTTTNWKEKQ